MKTGFISSKSSLNHDTGDGHPENKFRIKSILERLKKKNFSNLEWSKPVKFNKSYLNKTHHSLYIDEVNKAFPTKGKFFLDIDTGMSLIVFKFSVISSPSFPSPLDKPL